MSPAPQGALAVAGVAALACAGLAAVALADGTMPDVPFALVAPAVCAATVGYAAGACPWPWPRWTRRRLWVGLALGAACGLAGAVWFLVRAGLAPLAETGLPTMIDALAFLPGLVAWAALRQPGAVLLGLVAGESVAAVVTGAAFPALALLQAPVAAAPVEAWFLARGPASARAGTGLAGAGLLLGLTAAAAGFLLVPGAASASEWAVLAVMRGMAGLVAGWLMGRVAARPAWTRLTALLTTARDAA